MIKENAKYFFLQVDGLSYFILNNALEDGLMPNFQKWLGDKKYFFRKHFTGVPSSTLSFQGRFFFGTDKDILTYRWFDKSRQLPLSADTATIMSIMRRLLKLKTRPAFHHLVVFESFFSPGDNSQSLAKELLVEGSKTQKKMYSEIIHSLIDPKIMSPFIRNFIPTLTSNISLWVGSADQRVPISLVDIVSMFLPVGFLHHFYKEEIIKAFRTSPNFIYYNISAYDASSHFFGTYSPPTKTTLTILDREIMDILQMSERAGYTPVIFSDHGQTDSKLYIQLNKQTLAETISSISGVTIRNIEEDPKHTFFDRTRKKLKSTTQFYILDNGPMALIYFPKENGQLTRQEIEVKVPGLLERLLNSSGIGLIAVKDKGNSYWLVSNEGEIRVDPNGKIIESKNTNPLIKYGDYHGTLKSLARWINFSNQGDIIIFGDFDGTKTVNFEPQVAGHSGLGGYQNWSFYCCPSDYESKFINLIATR